MSTLAGFHTVPLSWSNWNLEMLIFAWGGGGVGGGIVENLEKNHKSTATIKSKLNPHMALSWNRN